MRHDRFAGSACVTWSHYAPQSDETGMLAFHNITDGVYLITGTALQHTGAHAIVTVIGPTTAQLILSLQPVQVRCSRA